jgi:5-methylcytosine-specific restriction endonuclease McrA
MKEWSDGRLKSFITSGIRSMFRRWPNKFMVLNEAKRGKHLNERTGRIAEHYICAMCNSLSPAKEVQVDHINPVVDPEIGFVDWNTFIDRLLCPKENLQVLCLACHLVKTRLEKEKRKKK